jgi:hypothetical protein
MVTPRFDQSEKRLYAMNLSLSCILFLTRPFVLSVNDGEQVEPCVKASSPCLNTLAARSMDPLE